MSAARRTVKRPSRAAATSPRRRWVLSLVTAGVVALAAGALGGVYMALSQPGRLPLRVIEVNGEFRHLDRHEIQRVVGDAIDGGFFTVDMLRLRTAVLAMPWVDDVSVRRRWPDRLSMVVTEQVPTARWGGHHLVNRRGDVFRPSSVSPFTALTHLSGPPGSARRVVDFYRRVADRTGQRGLVLREVELDERRHWWLRFDGDLTVSLGREQVDYRLAQFLRVYPSLTEGLTRRPQRIDMRYAHGFAVRWHRDAPGDAREQGPSAEDRA